MRLLPFALIAAAALPACATSSSTTRRQARLREQQQQQQPVAPTCAVRERLLAPVSRQPRAAMVRAFAAGLAAVWIEHEGDRDAVRLLVVDDKGAPRSPSAEIVDRAATLTLPDVSGGTPEGFVVTWTEPSGRFERAVDLRGRPRGDSVAATSALSTSEPPHCGREADHLSCATQDGPMRIPHDEEPVAATPSGVVVSLGPNGLRLFLNDCRK